MSSDEHFSGAVAVIGLACRVPGADTPEQLWRNLRSGTDSITHFSEEELLAAGVPLEEIRDPSYVPAKGVLTEADSFDAAFFGLSPREAALADPQQRVFLECAWSALEDAGYDSHRVSGPIGVFAGTILSTYLLRNLWSNQDLMAAAGNFQAAVGNDPTFLATSASYHLDLRGPSISVGTACSTSLVAVHLACQSLLAHESDMALAGGVSIHLPLIAGYRYESGGILSPDGRCRPFSAEAQGTVSSDGAGVVVLKRLQDAEADGDVIRAVILGSAINNDGRLKVGYTAPSVTGEAEVIGEALAMAGVGPETLSMVETHGAGTLLGDPIEVEALHRAFGTSDRKHFCALGSVKANLGHLDAAAGIAGLIKTVLALENGEIPPVPYFEQPNPQLKLQDSPFYVNRELRPMSGTGDQAPRAGVSSFGIGGTNAHVILQQAPAGSEPSHDDPHRCHDLLVLSARSAEALESATDRLVAHLEEHPDEDFADVCFTLRHGRRSFEHRRAVVCRNATEARQALADRDAKQWIQGVAPTGRPTVAFMFPGLGDNYPAMGWQLYCQEPDFRVVIDHCAELLEPHLGTDLRDSLYPDRDWKHPVWEDAEPSGGDGFDLAAMLGRSKKTTSEAADENPPIIAQPMIFVTELALAQLLLSWGITPDAMIGHSIGELAAAACAGVFDLPEALELVAHRARLIQEQAPRGSMLAVPLTEQELTPLLPETVDLAAVNGNALCVVSGETSGIAALELELKARNVQCRRLRSSHAFHSRMMETILEPLEQVIRRLTLSPPSIPYVSCLTGDWITDDQATDPEYWVRHLCRTVRFNDGLGRLLEDPQRILLEVGPGQGLTSHALSEKIKRPEGRNPVIPTMRWSYDRRPESAVLLKAVAELCMAGVELDTSRLLVGGQRRRVRLPTYPFERRRHWIEPASSDGGAQTVRDSTRAPGKISDVSKWFYLPWWKPSAVSAVADDATWPEEWWVFTNPDSPAGSSFGSKLIQRLRDLGSRVVRIEHGNEFSRTGDRMTLRPDHAEDYAELSRALLDRGLDSPAMLHLWTLSGAPAEAPSAGRFHQYQKLGYNSLMLLLQGLSRQLGSLHRLRIEVVSDYLFDIGDAVESMPEKATLRAPSLVAPQEHPGLRCRCLDIGPTGSPSQEAEALHCLVRELRSQDATPAVAYRRGRRFTLAYEPIELAAATGQSAPLRERGVYLLTGGLGGVGLILARYLASTVRARLVLLGRTTLPAREQWPAILSSTGQQQSIQDKIRAVQELEALGAEVLVLAADVADGAALDAALHAADQRFGVLHGVIHGAGLPGIEAFREINQASIADSEAQFKAKVYGLMELERALGDRRLDFCLLMSSLSAVLGGLGFAGYSAANLFMDAFTTWKNRASGEADTDSPATPWISVDWDSWRQPGAEPVIRGLGATVNELTMDPDEGAEALMRMLGDPRLGQVVVSSGDLQARLDQWTTQGTREPVSANTTVHERPELASTYIAPRNDLEQQLVELWQELFGVSPVGVDDNFFDLGGHSLLATQLNARLYSVLKVEMSLATLLQTPTVSELAVVVSEQQFEQSDPDELAALLAEVGDLSPEEAVRLLVEE